MNTTFSKSLRFVFAFGAALWLVTPCGLTQSPPGLSVQVSHGSARLTITGAVGTACEVQYATNLTQTNAWSWLTDLTLALNPLSLVDTSCPATGKRFYRAVWAPTNMVLIPAGSFTMGNCMKTNEGNSDELPLHTVYLSAFYMDKYLVTSNLWYAVKAWNDGNGYSYDYPGSGTASAYPVVNILWFDMVKWSNARSQMEGLVPCYYTDSDLTVVYKTGQVMNPYVNWSANGYRLPTEAEWEKAARGGFAGHRFPWSDVDTISWSRANYNSQWCGTTNIYPCSAYDVNSRPGSAFNYGPSPVGYFAANGYGLYDMTGNVKEACWDWYDYRYYSSSPAIDPRGPRTANGQGDSRVWRGGNFISSAFYARCALRDWGTPLYGGANHGFRCVRRL